MTESTTPRPEADADASRPGDHGAHHKGRTNPIPETRGLRPHYAAEATRDRSSNSHRRCFWFIRVEE